MVWLRSCHALEKDGRVIPGIAVEKDLTKALSGLQAYLVRVGATAGRCDIAYHRSIALEIGMAVRIEVFFSESSLLR